MSRADEYRSIFNEIESLLYKKYGAVGHLDLGTIISELAKKDKVIAAYRNDLREYSELRNAIVHQSRNQAIAEPYPETISSLRDLLNKLTNPQTSRDICTKDVTTFTTEDSIIDAIKKMADLMLTNVPVYDGNELIGVLSEQSYVRWLASCSFEDGFILSETKIIDIITALDPISGANDNEYMFVKPTVDVFTIQDMFEDSLSRGKRLSAVFVTNSGKRADSLLGIITAWDLARVKR